MRVTLTITILVWCYLGSLNFSHSADFSCNTTLSPANDDPSSSNECLQELDRCTYRASIGSIFKPIYLIFYDNKLVCGGDPYGRLRIEGHNYEQGKIDIAVLEKIGGNDYFEENEKRKVIYRGALTKRITKELIIWEGYVRTPDGSEQQSAYIKRNREFRNIFANKFESPPFGVWDKELIAQVENSDLEDGYIYSSKELHGAYYCGDGGCEAEGIGVIVRKDEIDHFLARLKKSGLQYLSVKFSTDDDRLFCYISSYGSQIYERIAKTLGIEDEQDFYDETNPEAAKAAKSLKDEFICIHVNAVPLHEPHVTMSLRKFPEVYAARRLGGGAGADAISFFVNGQTFLRDSNSLNFGRAIEVFGSALGTYYPSSSNYDISDPFVRNNSIFWNVKGRRVALEKRRNFSVAEAAEWWKLRIQLFIAQKNFQEYVLVLNLPETRVTNWGFDSFPVDEKFEKELTNDPRFLDFRDRLIGVLTKEINDPVFIP
ncbi:hypothetical protein [Rhodobium gokarnense]|uniref:YARHG domain-containing protein n=1 Tax=Rhodobium gokarnense TaxID=364296 RepID=A0ABT3HC27_9HYPH|nr:hypothetical protein [Rhodobium gokarnense]MCW2307948.1 hypothetical protein [Rhodobium gokarnense]